MARPRYRLTSALLAASVAFGAGACASGESDAEPTGDSAPVTVGLTFIPNVQFAPVYLADFEAEGLTASIRHHGSEESLFSALATGEEDIVIASGDEVLQARAEGLDVVSIGAYYHEYPVEVVVPADSPIETLADMRGYRIGIPGEFGSSWFGFLAALNEAGLERTDVELVTTGFTQSAALVGGDVDAIVAFKNSEPVQLAEMGFQSRSLPLNPSESPLVGASIISSAEWTSNHPGEAEAAVAAIVAGIQAAIDDPEAALAATAEWDESLADPQAQAGALAILEATTELWKGPEGKATAVQNEATWSNMGPLLAKLLQDPELTDYQTGAVTNEFTTPR